MKRKCLDEGTLQGYMDGELSPAASREAETHLAQCTVCTEALNEAAGELALFSTAFAPDPSVSVPTEALQRRLDAAIGELRAAPEAGGALDRSGWNLKSWLGALLAPLAFTPQRAAAFASLVAVVAFAVIFMTIRPQRSDVQEGGGRQVAAVPQAPPSGPTTDDGGGQEKPSVAATGHIPPRADSTPHSLVKVKGDRKRSAHIVKPTSEGANTTAATTAATSPEDEIKQRSVPGEEHYQQAIASLSRAIEGGGDGALGPTLRADYERNLAVVDKAITETRRAALRNPQDAGASAFLFSAYQSKIDLLTAVADQAQSSTLGR
jgi:hypothetical protein